MSSLPFTPSLRSTSTGAGGLGLKAAESEPLVFQPLENSAMHSALAQEPRIRLWLG